MLGGEMAAEQTHVENVHRELSVLLVVQSGFVRELLTYWLERQPHVHLVGSVGSGHAALSTLGPKAGVDLILRDSCRDPISQGWVQTARRLWPKAQWLVLTDLPAGHLLRVEADQGEQVTPSVQGLAQALSSAKTDRAAQAPAGGLRVVAAEEGVQTQALATLSGRELQVLHLTARGLTKKQMATELGLSVKTVENISARLMNKLGIHDRVGLARLAIREGLIEA